MKFRFIILLSYLFIEVKCLKEGDSCTVENLPGVCRNLTRCDYALRLVTERLVKPTHCAWQKGSFEEVVCCPIHEHWTGLYRNAFIDTEDGVIRGNNMACHYEGIVPLVCCQEETNLRELPEPPQCPPMQPVQKRLSHKAWEKCVGYQRYADVCEKDPLTNKYGRRFSCGITELGNKIAGGIPANYKEFPHMALLGFRGDMGYGGVIMWAAGGSLISDKYILTAAHALSNNDAPVRYALLGALNKSQTTDGLIHNVIRRLPHKLYSPNEKYHDIALLELGIRVIFSEFIRPACLPVPGMTLSQDRVIAGWGQQGAGRPTAEILLKAYVQEEQPSVCRRTVDAQSLSRGWDEETMICTTASSNDSCQGDSGGPMMAYAEDLKCGYVVQGIVSFGPSCGQNSPGVYTKVDYYIDWITSVVWPKG